MPITEKTQMKEKRKCILNMHNLQLILYDVFSNIYVLYRIWDLNDPMHYKPAWTDIYFTVKYLGVYSKAAIDLKNMAYLHFIH